MGLDKHAAEMANTQLSNPNATPGSIKPCDANPEIS
jgi:hypothetical protein